MNAAGYPASVIAGRIAVDAPSQNPTVTQPSRHANTYTNTAAITKFGTVTPRVARIIASLSCHFPRRSAEIIPAGIPTSSASTIAAPPTAAETGKFCAMSSLTERPSYLYDGPKSSRRMFIM